MTPRMLIFITEPAGRMTMEVTQIIGRNGDVNQCVGCTFIFI